MKYLLIALLFFGCKKKDPPEVHTIKYHAGQPDIYSFRVSYTDTAGVAHWENGQGNWQKEIPFKAGVCYNLKIVPNSCNASTILTIFYDGRIENQSQNFNGVTTQVQNESGTNVCGAQLQACK